MNEANAKTYTVYMNLYRAMHNGQEVLVGGVAHQSSSCCLFGQLFGQEYTPPGGELIATGVKVELPAHLVSLENNPVLAEQVADGTPEPTVKAA